MVASSSDQAAPFSLGPARAPRGALLVHGFTGSPFEMRPLGEHLAGRNFAVEGPLLAGHLSSTRALARSNWQDWVASAEQALDSLSRRAQRIAVVGLSMGGLVTAELSRRHPDRVHAIGLLSTALWLKPEAIAFARASQFVPFFRNAALPKLAGSDIRDPAMKRANRAAAGRAWMPFRALNSLLEFGEHTRAHLHAVAQPAFVAHGRLDHTVPFECMDAVCARIATPIAQQRRLILEHSYHCITLDVEREALFAALTEFLERHLGE